MRPALYALLAVFAGLAFTAPPAVAAPTLAEAQAIAYAAFPGHCGPELIIEWDHPMLIANGWEGAAVIGDPNCAIHLISAHRDTARSCDMLVHERGHVAGHEHAATGVMAPWVEPWPACHPPATTVRVAKSRQEIARSIRFRRLAAKVRARSAARRGSAASRTPARSCCRR